MNPLTLRREPLGSNARTFVMVTESLPRPVGRDMAVILALAACLESSQARCLHWYYEESIESLGGRSAEELVAIGHACQVVRFLCRCVWADTAGLGTY